MERQIKKGGGEVTFQICDSMRDETHTGGRGHAALRFRPAANRVSRLVFSRNLSNFCSLEF